MSSPNLLKRHRRKSLFLSYVVVGLILTAIWQLYAAGVHLHFAGYFFGECHTVFPSLFLIFSLLRNHVRLFIFSMFFFNLPSNPPAILLSGLYSPSALLSISFSYSFMLLILETYSFFISRSRWLTAGIRGSRIPFTTSVPPPRRSSWTKIYLLLVHQTANSTQQNINTARILNALKFTTYIN